MRGPARLSCRSGVGRSGASRSGAFLTAADSLPPRVEGGVVTATGWRFEDLSDRRRTEDDRELAPDWTLQEPS